MMLLRRKSSHLVVNAQLSSEANDPPSLSSPVSLLTPHGEGFSLDTSEDEYAALPRGLEQLMADERHNKKFMAWLRDNGHGSEIIDLMLYEAILAFENLPDDEVRRAASGRVLYAKLRERASAEIVSDGTKPDSRRSGGQWTKDAFSIDKVHLVVRLETSEAFRTFYRQHFLERKSVDVERASVAYRRRSRTSLSAVREPSQGDEEEEEDEEMKMMMMAREAAPLGLATGTLPERAQRASSSTTTAISSSSSSASSSSTTVSRRGQR